MAHSNVKIWIHVIIGVKHRDDLILPKFERLIYKIISREISKMGCKLFAINGTENHIHALIMLKSTISVSDLMKRVKGASSRMISRLKLITGDFNWQTGYGAYSVSEKNLKWLIKYIQNQKEHHKEVNYMDESKILKNSGDSFKPIT